MGPHYVNFTFTFDTPLIRPEMSEISPKYVAQTFLPPWILSSGPPLDRVEVGSIFNSIQLKLSGIITTHSLNSTQFNSTQTTDLSTTQLNLFSFSVTILIHPRHLFDTFQTPTRHIGPSLLVKVRWVVVAVVIVLAWPVLTWPDLSWLDLTCPDLTWLDQSWLETPSRPNQDTFQATSRHPLYNFGDTFDTSSRNPLNTLKAPSRHPQDSRQISAP